MNSLPFTHTIYTLITHKCKRGHLERKILDRFSITHTLIFLRESYSSLVRNHCSLFSIPLPCHTLRGYLYPNTTHTYSECRECFGAWEALGNCQKKLVRLGGCNRVDCGIWRAREDKAWRSQLVAGAWRAFCYSCTPTYSLVDQLPLGGWRRGFLPSSLVSSSITCLSVICVCISLPYSCSFHFIAVLL